MSNTAQQHAVALHELSKDKDDKQKSDIIQSLIQTLKKKKIFFMLPQIIKELQNINTREARENTIRVSTATKLTKEKQEEIKTRFGEGNYIFEENDGLIAGIIVQKNNTLLHATLSKAIMQLEKNLKV